MNPFEKLAAVNALLSELESKLPELNEKSIFFYQNKEERRDGWLITQTQYQTYESVVKKLKEILK